MKNRICLIFLLSLIFVFYKTQYISANELNWVWYYSSDYVSEYYSPESLKIIKDYNGNIDHIEVWTKTTYSQEGAEDTINSYGLTNVPNIYQLSYSLAKIYIKPYNRQIVWQNEVFYNNEGKSLWSKEKTNYQLDWEEAYPNSENERYFSFITDQVFHKGQTIDFDKWKTGKDRWVGLSKSNNNGTVTLVWFDNASMRVDNNLITYWAYYETRQDDSIVDKFYIKAVLDRKDQKVRYIGVRFKDKNGDWRYRNMPNGNWHSVIPGSIGENQMAILMQYVDSHVIDNMNKIPVANDTKGISNKFPFEFKPSKNI